MYAKKNDKHKQKHKQSQCVPKERVSMSLINYLSDTIGSS